MKLSKREKVLILILIIAIIVYAGSKLVPSGLFSLKELREEYAGKSNEYNTMSQNIILKSKYEENLQAITDEINSLNVISDLRQEQLIVFLNNYFANSNINVSNISFTEASAVPAPAAAQEGEPKAPGTLEKLMNDIDGASAPQTAPGAPGNTGKVTEAAEGTQEAQAGTPSDGASENESSENETADSETPEDSSGQQPSLTVKQISVSISFESTYGDMLNFIDAIQNNPVDISVTNISTVSSEGGLLQGTMTLNFYEVPKPAGFTETNGEWIWQDLAQYGKTNPFSVDGAAVFAATGGSFDFYINLEPESSDLPTVLIGKTEDTSRSTYISENSNSVENVEFSFKAENGKYYYRYSTKNNSYPKAGAWQEFTPSTGGGISIIVHSSDRSSRADSVGANIGVTNSSGLKVYFEVENDVIANPRVIFRDSKSVIVTRR